MTVAAFVFIFALAIYGWVCVIQKLHGWAVRKLDDRLQHKITKLTADYRAPTYIERSPYGFTRTKGHKEQA